ncbi:hypothetical protein [Burkholderia ubonensis]|uniref:hypothetical protein n=1 Tax=Burkholderia ubonensis TaxID=101571 RepID=UPI0012F746B2|nr:hypothetical protein [Burkholderia ubonensis]
MLTALGALDPDVTMCITSWATAGVAAVAVLPATTAAGLAAAATFATGTRTVLDSDIYGRAGASIIDREIRNDYFPAILTFTKTIPDTPSIGQFTESYVKLTTIHNTCSLQFALSNVNMTGPKPPPISKDSLQSNQAYFIPPHTVIKITKNADNWKVAGLSPKQQTLDTTALVTILNADGAILIPGH